MASARIAAAEPALGIVRRYTDQRQQENHHDTLTHRQALVSKVDADREEELWGRKSSRETALDTLRTFDGTHEGEDVFLDVAELDEVTAQLQGDWNKVISTLPKKERSMLPSKPSITTLSLLFKEANENLEAKQRSNACRAKKWFRDVAGTIDKHKYLLKLLPEGDKYTSVLVGSFTVLVQVAVTYEKSAETINDCLEKLSGTVRHLRNALESKPENRYIRQQVGKFYIHFFRFLVHILVEWYSSAPKRIWNSFGNSLVEECDKAIRKMDGCLNSVMRELQLIAHRQMDVVVNQLGRLSEANLMGTVMDHFFRTSDTPLATQPPGFLPRSNGRLITARHPDTSPDPSSSNSEMGDDRSNEPNEDDGLDDLWTKERICEAVKHLEVYYQDAYVTRLLSRAKHVAVSAEVRADILKMAASKKSAALWLEGPADQEPPSHATLTSAHILQNLSQLGMPTLGNFIVRPRREPLNRERALLHMTLSLVYQISQLLVDDIRFRVDLRAKLAPFRSPAESGPGVTASLVPAVELLEALLGIAPPLIFCVVDGLQLLERRSNSTELDTALERFVDCVCAAASRPSTEDLQIFKALFTTNGPCRELRYAVKDGLIKRVVCGDEDDDEPIHLRGEDIQ